jgi:conjugative element/phage-associated large polyvalent protein
MKSLRKALFMSSAPDFLSLIESAGIDEFFPQKQPSSTAKTPSKRSSSKATPDFFSELPDVVGGGEPAQRPKQKPDFFAGMEPEPLKVSTTPYDAPDLTPEQLKGMSLEERQQYAKDLVTEREYRTSKGMTKGALSGLTFGLSEKIPGLAPEEGEYLASFGEFLGSALPISKLYNYLGKPLVSLAAKSPKYAQGLQSLARMTGFGLTGAAYEGGKDTIKTGEVPSAEELAMYGLQWAAFDGALQLAGKAVSFLPKLKTIAQANNVPERQVVNDIMDSLAERKINIEKDPEAAIAAAQDILENYPRKMESAREERIAGLKVKEVEAERKITEPIKEKAEKVTEQQKDVITGRKEEVSKAEQSFEKKQEILKTKSAEIDLEADAALEKIKEKEEALTSKFEEQKEREVEKLRTQSGKEVDAKSREIEKSITALERDIEKRKAKTQKELSIFENQIEKAQTKNEPTKRLEKLKSAIQSKADKTIEALQTAIDKQKGRLESFREKTTAGLEKKIEKTSGKKLPSSAMAPLEKEISTLDRVIASKKKVIADAEVQLTKEKSRKIEEMKRDAQVKLKALEGKKAQLERSQAERLKAQRAQAYAERHPTIEGTLNKIPPAAKVQAVVEPRIETTGKGAAERIEYAPTGINKIISKMNNFIQAAKTPGASLKRLGEATNEAVFNALAPLERVEGEIPLHEKVSTRIKLAQSAASEIDSVLEKGIFSNLTGNFEHGGLKQAYGDLTWKKLSKGLKEGEHSLQDLDTYRVSKAALKRQAEGKKTGVDTKKATQDIKRLKSKYEPIDKRIREFQKATLVTYGKDLLGTDLIAQWNKDYYAPLYRVMEEGKDSILAAGSLKPKQPFKKMVGSERKIIPPSESDTYNAAMLIRNARKNDAILQYRKLVLDGQLPGKIKSAKLEPMPTNIALDELGIDPEMRKLAEALYNQTRTNAFTPEKNILRGWKDGKPFTIEVPEEIYNVFSTLAPQDRGSIAKLFSATNRLFSRGISLEPRKFVSIMSRDALSSLIYSRTGSNPVSIAEALADIYGGKAVYKEFLSMGGDVYASRLAERIDRSKKIEDLITPGKKGILVPFEKIGDYFRKYSDTLGDISLAVPLAEYKRALAKYGNTAEGRIMAAMEARRVTYDPTRKGASKLVRELGNIIPFWNVSLQDMAMIGRNLNTPEAWAKGFAAISLPTLTLKMLNEGNPDYQELNPVDKAAFWHVYFGDKHLRIPIPWLQATVFKVGAETLFDTIQDMRGRGDGRAKEAWEGLYDNFTENVSGSLPPFATAYIEAATGKSPKSPLSAFLGIEGRAPDVVPRRLEGLPPKFQYTSKTSQLARWFGNYWNVSPVKVDRLIKGFGTNVAADVLALTDEIAYFTGMAEDKRPEQREANYLLFGHFLSTSPSRTKYAKEFYEYLNEASQNKKAQKLIREQGLEDSLEEIAYRNVPLGKFQREINKAFRDMRTVEDSDQYTPAEKKAELDRLQRFVNDKYKIAVDRVREAKAEK